MKGQEHHIGSNVSGDGGAEIRCAAAGTELDDVGAADVQTAREIGVQLRLGLHLGLGRARHSAGLGAALVLGHEPAGGQDIGIVEAGTLIGLVVFNPDELARPSEVGKLSVKSRGVPG